MRQDLANLIKNVKTKLRMRIGLTPIIATIVGMLLSVPLPARSEPATYKCDGKYAGQSVSVEELDRILSMHRQWLGSAHWDMNMDVFIDPAKDAAWYPNGVVLDPKLQQIQSDPRRANLCDADLSKLKLPRFLYLPGAILDGVNLEGANLKRANFNSAQMIDSHLKGADLDEANLDFAVLNGADLRSADLRSTGFVEAKLSAARMNRAKLIGTFLKDAELSDIHLEDADLQDADLSEAHLQSANFNGANLANVLFEPDLSRCKLLKAWLTRVICNS